MPGRLAATRPTAADRGEENQCRTAQPPGRITHRSSLAHRASQLFKAHADGPFLKSDGMANFGAKRARLASDAQGGRAYPQRGHPPSVCPPTFFSAEGGARFA